jgi:chemotaxis protein histidine kinase CheA
MSAPDFSRIEKIIHDLGQEFLVDAAESLVTLGEVVEYARSEPAEAAQALQTIRREAHNLKGLGGSFGFPSITLIAHRLEDYLSGLDNLAVRQLDNVLAFLDAMQDIVEQAAEPGVDEVSRIVRALPAKGAAKEDFQPTSDLEILLVAASSVLGHAVETKLHDLGFRVVTVKSPIHAFETAIRTRPDMVIASAVMEHVGGVDLARAFHAMTVTRDIPFVLLTSFDRDHSELRELPDSVSLIHHDRDLDGEIAGTIDQFGLTAG